MLKLFAVCMAVSWLNFQILYWPIMRVTTRWFSPVDTEKYFSEQQMLFDDFQKDLSSTRLIRKLPTPEVPKSERREFTFLKAKCTQLHRIGGDNENFFLCNSRSTFNRPIFLITQTRDMIMERSLINAVGKYAYVKVFFSKIPETWSWTCNGLDSIQNIQIKPYTRWNSNGSEIGIHDLLAHDLRSIEVIIYEAKTINDPIIFSILRHAIPQFLLHLQQCDYASLRYAIQRFIYNMYYPYAIVNSLERESCFISFVTKFHYPQYYIKNEIKFATLKNSLYFTKFI